MRTFAVAKDFTREVMDLAPDGLYEKVHIYPGPELPDDPGRFVMLTPYGGEGYEADGAIDARGWQVRVAGKQGDYDSAESLANWIDTIFTALPSSRVGGLWVTGIRRVGGAPNPLMLDDADRHHFVCSYMASVESALVN